MLLQHSRRDARVDDGGGLVLLPDQDRSRWHAEEIAEALALLTPWVHAPGTPYLLQALIAAEHAVAAERRGHRLVADRPALPRAGGPHRLARGPAQPCGRRGRGRRPPGRAGRAGGPGAAAATGCPASAGQLLRPGRPCRGGPRASWPAPWSVRQRGRARPPASVAFEERVRPVRNHVTPAEYALTHAPSGDHRRASTHGRHDRRRPVATLARSPPRHPAGHPRPARLARGRGAALALGRLVDDRAAAAILAGTTRPAASTSPRSCSPSAPPSSASASSGWSPATSTSCRR